jgi:hypothetical protein
MIKQLNICIITIASIMIFLIACKKEYSYEGGANLLPPLVDSISPPLIDTNEKTLGSCVICDSSEVLHEFSWRFKPANPCYVEKSILQ